MHKLYSLLLVLFIHNFAFAQGVSLIAQLSPSYGLWASESVGVYPGIQGSAGGRLYTYRSSSSVIGGQIGLETNTGRLFSSISFGFQRFNSVVLYNFYGGSLSEREYLEIIREYSQPFKFPSDMDPILAPDTLYFNKQVETALMPKLVLGLGFKLSEKNRVLFQLSQWDYAISVRRDVNNFLLSINFVRFYTPLYELDSSPIDPRDESLRQLQYANFSAGLSLGYRIPLKGRVRNQKKGSVEEF
jgi:hypothetical protein